MQLIPRAEKEETRCRALQQKRQKRNPALITTG